MALRTSAEIFIDLPTHLLANERSLSIWKVRWHISVPDLGTGPRGDEVEVVRTNYLPVSTNVTQFLRIVFDIVNSHRFKEWILLFGAWKVLRIRN